MKAVMHPVCALFLFCEMKQAEESDIVLGASPSDTALPRMPAQKVLCIALQAGVRLDLDQSHAQDALTRSKLMQRD